MSEKSPKMQVAEQSLKQGELFMGEWQAEPPKRGTGSHVRLKALDGEKPAVPGMASYAGEGPVGTYCKDCGFFGKVGVQRSPDAAEKNSAGCTLYAQRMGHAAPTPHRDIRACAACKHFVEADEAPRNFIVDQAGDIYRVDNLPENLRRWQPGPGNTPISLLGAVPSAETN
jgi:hypothetical protein